MAAAEALDEEAAPQVSGILPRVLADIAAKHGISTEQLFEGHAEPFLSGAPMDVRMTLPALGSLIHRALALTAEPALGLRCGFDSSDTSFDLLAPLVGHLSSLRQAIREVGRFSALVIRGAHLHVIEDAGVVTLRWELPRIDPDTDRFVAELAMAGMLRLVYGFGGTRADLRAVRFEHCRPSASRAYAELFHGTERFASAFTALELSAGLLDRPHIHHNPALQSLVHEQAEQGLAQLAKPIRFASRMLTYLRNQPHGHVPEIAQAARALKLSVRTLRRRLAVEGLAYRTLTQRVQLERARELLRDPDQTLKAISDATGFANTAAFHRAFKRWTGQTAHAYRGVSVTGTARDGRVVPSIAGRTPEHEPTRTSKRSKI